MALEVDINLLYDALIVLLILVIAYVFGKITAKILKETFKKAGIPETETAMIASVTKYVIYLAGILIALGYIGIPVVSFLIPLALVGTVLGIAARSALGSIASGYFLRLYGPFDVGDVIEIEGKTGRVKDLTPLKTVIETAEHLVYSIPNSKVMESEIYNFTRYKSNFPVELQIEVTREVDLEDVKLQILDVLNSYTKIDYEKPVKITIEDFTERGILLKILFYVPNFEIKQGAKDFVANKILTKSKTGEIPLLQSFHNRIARNHPQNTRDLELTKTRRAE